MLELIGLGEIVLHGTFGVVDHHLLLLAIDRGDIANIAIEDIFCILESSKDLIVVMGVSIAGKYLSKEFISNDC